MDAVPKEKPRAKKSPSSQETRSPDRTAQGIVRSDKMKKTITVDVERLVQDRRFGKYVRRFSRCVAHDEKNEAKVGDWVEIVESRPLSATKRWRMRRVLRRAERSSEIVSASAEVSDTLSVRRMGVHRSSEIVSASAEVSEPRP